MNNTRLSARALLVLTACCVCAVGPTVRASGQAPVAESPRALDQAGEPAARSALPLELVGVMADSADPARSACLIRCTYPGGRRSAVMVGVGSPVCDLAEIREIRQEAVVIRNLLTNRLDTLPLQTAGGPPPTPISQEPPVPAVVKSTADLVSVDVPKASVDHYLVNLPELLSSALATPRYRDVGGVPGTIDGFEIGQIKAGSVVEQIGLRNGDVILEVNGETLDSLATVMRLFGQAQTMSQVKLTVLRGSQRMTFVFNTK